MIKKITTGFTTLNNIIEKDLSPGFLVGHSYFCNFLGKNKMKEKVWYEMIINMEIKPLLEEYWFDKPREAESQINLLLKE